jgi:putative peptide zinc metalloprotease protein
MSPLPDNQPLLAARPSRPAEVEIHWRPAGSAEAAVLKHQRLGTYYQLSSGSAFIWNRCDGTRTVADVARDVAASGGPSDPQRVLEVICRLGDRGFLDGTGTREPPAAESRTASGFAGAVQRVLTFRVTIRGCDPAITWLYRHGGFLPFTGPMKLLLAAIICLGFIAFAALRTSATISSAEMSLNWLWAVPPLLYGCIFFHEFGHALAVKYFGREVVGVGFGWFWIGPIFFVDTSDMWLAGRRERILVSLAGSISDLTIAGTLSLVACFAGPAVATAATTASGVLYLMVIGNLSPLLEYDGYYALSDLLGRPNLRRQSLFWLFSEFRIGRTPWADIVRHKVEFLYGVGSLVYMAFLLFMNAIFNHAFFSHVLSVPGYAWLAAPLSGLITLLLLLIFMFGLLSDVRRQLRP